MSKIIIHLDGGVIQWVTKLEDKSRKVSVIVVDTDTEDAGDDENLIWITNENDQKVSAYVHEEEVYPAKNDTDIYHFTQTYFDKLDIEQNTDPKNLPLLLSQMRTQEGRDQVAKLLKKE